MPVNVKLERDLAEAFYEKLLAPTQDIYGRSIYVVDINTAGELRMALREALDGND